MLKNILFVPGLLNTRALYNSQIQKLSPFAHITVGDHFQHDNIPDIARHILSSAPEKFALVGLSMGGYVCMEIMRQAGHRVTQLVLMDTSARADTPEQTARREVFMRNSMVGQFRGVTRQLITTLIHEKHHDSRLITDVIYDMALEVGRDAFIRQQKAIIGRQDSRESLKSITCPARIICGQQDKLTPPEVAQEMASLIPNAELHLLEECGHLAPLESPEEVNEILYDFLV